jgi:exonuclease III
MSGDVETNPGPNNTWSIACYNVSGLKNKLDLVLADLGSYDVIAITESHLTPNIDNAQILFEGFNEPYRCDRQQAWGGVCVYVSRRFAAIRRCDLECPDLEMVCIEIQDVPKTLIYTIYRPPNTPIAKWQNINDIIELGMENNCNLIIIGDLNDDLFKNSNHHLKDLIRNMGLTQLIKEPTRPVSNSLLDPIICNKPQLVNSSGTLPPVCSDHVPVYVTLKTRS